MISKIFSGQSFADAIDYIVRDEQHSEALLAEGIRDYDYRLMIEDFRRQQSLHPEKTKACFHSILSFSPLDQLSNEMLIKIASTYLTELGFENTQYVVLKHTGKPHLYLRIIANHVDNDGKVISDKWIGLRGKKIAQRLTKEYDLIPATKNNIDKSSLQAT